MSAPSPNTRMDCFNGLPKISPKFIFESQTLRLIAFSLYVKLYCETSFAGVIVLILDGDGVLLFVFSELHALNVRTVNKIKTDVLIKLLYLLLDNIIMDWKTINDQLVKEFEFKDFTEAWGFMSKVALAAEKMDHHPEWTNTYNKVVVRLSTHSEGNIITEKDRKLAEVIDRLL